MIVSEGKYYLYRHIRLDKNEPFYIGIGTKKEGCKTYSCFYKRANDSSNRRNKLWKDVNNKTKYEVEILLESDDYEFIKQKEIEFTILYGRKDLKTGSLCNLTNGGEGCLGTIFTEERNKKISDKNKGRVKTKKEIALLSTYKTKKVINKSTNEVFESIQLAADSENITHSSLYQQLNCCSKKCKFKYEDESLNYNRRNNPSKKYKPRKKTE